MKSWLSLAAAIAFAVVGTGPASCAPPKEQTTKGPAALEFTGFVVDQAGVLSPELEQRLTHRLDALQRRTEHQFAVVTVSSLGGEDVESFTTRLANRWGVGRKGLNDGIVLLVAPNERKARMAVGNGLTRTLPDSFCQSVMDGEMIPAFRRDEIGQGIEAGVRAIIARFQETSTLP